MRLDASITYRPNAQYATVKMFAVWWAAELAMKLPSGMTVNVVSPGSTPGTNGARSAPFLMKWVLIPIVKVLPGLSHSVSDGAARYLEATAFGPERTGEFLASKPKKGTGPLQVIEMDHFNNPVAQEALWRVTTTITGGVDYPANAVSRQRRQTTVEETT